MKYVIIALILTGCYAADDWTPTETAEPGDVVEAPAEAVVFDLEDADTGTDIALACSDAFFSLENDHWGWTSNAVEFDDEIGATLDGDGAVLYSPAFAIGDCPRPFEVSFISNAHFDAVSFGSFEMNVDGAGWETVEVWEASDPEPTEEHFEIEFPEADVFEFRFVINADDSDGGYFWSISSFGLGFE